MNLAIELSKDAKAIALLNEPVQELHYKRYPEYFKPYSFEETHQYFLKQLEADNWFCYVVSENEKPIGYGLFFIREYKENTFRKSYKAVHIDQICILEKYRNQGIGKALVKKMEDFGRTMNASEIELTYWEKNIEAKGFYKLMGFESHVDFVSKKL